MARYTGPDCRLCRREKMKLFLKGPKCDTPKCPVERRPYPPGEQGRNSGRRNGSEYLNQLREKQKARRIYGVLEKQFVNLYEEATRQIGITGENLLKMLELRLDNVVFRAGWAASRDQARQLVRHGHVQIDGKKVNIPSVRLRKSQKVSLGTKARGMIVIQHHLDTSAQQVPAWLERSGDRFDVIVLNEPLREQIDIPVHEQQIVELYSK